METLPLPFQAASVAVALFVGYVLLDSLLLIYLAYLLARSGEGDDCL